MSERNDIVKKLKKRGYKSLGMGTYAEVFGHPKRKRVYKVIHKYDEAYLEYARRIKGMNNPYLPKIYRIVEGSGDLEAVVIMEKLETIAIKDKNRTVSKTFNKKIDKGYEDYGISLRRNDLESIFESTACKKLKEAIQIILEVAEDWFLDLHDANYMFRNEGGELQLVFSDPVSTP